MVCTRLAHTCAPVLKHQVCNLAPRLAFACQRRAVPLHRLGLERRAGTSFCLIPIIHEGWIVINPAPPLDCHPTWTNQFKSGSQFKLAKLEKKGSQFLYPLFIHTVPPIQIEGGYTDQSILNVSI